MTSERTVGNGEYSVWVFLEWAHVNFAQVLIIQYYPVIYGVSNANLLLNLLLAFVALISDSSIQLQPNRKKHTS